MDNDRDHDSYVNKTLGFALHKPADWVFIPTTWAVRLRNRNAPSSEELRRVLEQAKAPFVYAHLPHERQDSPYPTLQASCRPMPAGLPTPEAFLGQLLAQLERQFSDLELLESSAQAIVGGRPAIILKTRISLQNTEGARFHCLSHSYTLFGGALAFSVGLSCAAEGPYQREQELVQIARSIRIS